MISGAQIRSARAFLAWTRIDLAAQSNVATSTIQTIEAFDGSPEISHPKWRGIARKKAIESISEALMRAGVAFLHSEDASGLSVKQDRPQLTERPAHQRKKSRKR